MLTETFGFKVYKAKFFPPIISFAIGKLYHRKKKNVMENPKIANLYVLKSLITSRHIVLHEINKSSFQPSKCVSNKKSENL